jgi:hypothetical protein
MYNIYHKNGVIVTPNVIANGDNITVTYKGLLYNSGASHVYMHVGTGENWSNINDIEMEKTSDGFEAKMPITSSEKLSMVFKDCADNWDNNSGRNYNFDVQDNMQIV